MYNKKVTSVSSLSATKLLFLCGAVLLLAFVSPAIAEENDDSENADNSTELFGNCQPGLIIPVWEPQEDLSSGDRVARAIVYFVGMVYLFIGVSIVSDRFMGSIEMITSQEKEVTVKKANGDTQIIVVQVWNETVANLTLMALGSSAPEILLSVIEIYASLYLCPPTVVWRQQGPYRSFLVNQNYCFDWP